MAKRGRKISLSGGLHTKLPPPEEFLPARWRTNEILLMLFAHMKMQERTYRDLQKATRTHERTLFEWKKYETSHGGNSKGPGLIQILDALHMVGLTLDVVPVDPDWLRTGVSLKDPLSWRTSTARTRAELTDPKSEESRWAEEDEEEA